NRGGIQIHLRGDAEGRRAARFRRERRDWFSGPRAGAGRNPGGIDVTGIIGHGEKATENIACATDKGIWSPRICAHRYAFPPREAPSTYGPLQAASARETAWLKSYRGEILRWSQIRCRGRYMADAAGFWHGTDLTDLCGGGIRAAGGNVGPSRSGAD